MTVFSFFRRPVLGLPSLMSTLRSTVAFVGYVEASRKAAFGMRVHHPMFVGVRALLATVATSATVLRGTMTWAAAQHLEPSAMSLG
jgi:hypothetical protein